MKLTENQIELIANYTDERYIDRAKLITYLESHKTVEKAVFAACSKVAPSKRLLEANERGYDDLAEYNPVERQTFIRRIPFYFYIPSDLKRGGRIFRLLRKFKTPEELEAGYQNLEFLFYEVGLPLKTIFEYPVQQARTPSKENGGWDFSFFEGSPYNPPTLFNDWVEYLKICIQLHRNEYTPRHFLTAYNEALEASGKSPIIYKPISDLGFYMVRDGRSYVCEGIFPCDENNTPILKWTNIRVEKPAYITFSSDYSWYGEMKIGLTPRTRIFLKGQYDCDSSNDEEVNEDEWDMVYSGPMNMSVDSEALKAARKAEKLTHKQVADAIGVSERTYQKWEYGDTIPDGHNLIRIMNWLNISDVQFLTEYTEPKEDN